MSAKPASNDLVLLDAVISELQPLGPEGLRDDEYFELFAFEQILKPYDLTQDELLDGQLGGGNDGGLDGLFAFADGRLLDENTDLTKARRGVEIVVYSMQAKREKGFSETAIQKANDTLGHLLNLGMTREELEKLGLYNDRVIEKAEIVRGAIRALANKRPNLKIVFAYATRGNVASAAGIVRQRADMLVADVEASLHGAKCDVRFVGARELYDLSQRDAERELELAYHQVPQSDGNNGYVALVELGNYHEFITEPAGAAGAARILRRYIFEGNVRDLERSQVNKEILETLNDPTAPQFWWMNNGVTIVCTEARIMNERLFLVDPLVVNGLQTSMVLHEFFATTTVPPETAKKLLLVRVMQSSDAFTRDRVIKATNRQTPVNDATLRATDGVQRDIETYFVHHGWFYDRRKNFYRNLGKPADRIITIPYLAQAVISIGLSRPNDARARPSSLLKDDKDYRSIFNPKYPIEIYLWAAKAQRGADVFLRSDRAAADAEERTNLRFYLSALVVALARRKRTTSADELSGVVGTTFTDDDFAATLDLLRKALSAFEKKTGLRPERIVKGSDFATFLFDSCLPGESKAA